MEVRSRSNIKSEEYRQSVITRPNSLAEEMRGKRTKLENERSKRIIKSGNYERKGSSTKK